MIIAGLWGGAEASKIVKTKESAAARQAVHSFIEKDLSATMAQVKMGFDRAFASLRMQADDALAKIVKKSLEELNQTRSDLKERVRLTGKEVSEAKKKIQLLDSQVQMLEKQLSAMDKLVL
jgi:hypothetical protein